MRTLSLGFLVAVAALLFFAWLATAVLRGQTADFDASVRASVHSWASPPLTEVMKGFTQLGAVPFIVLLCALTVWRLVSGGRPRAAALLIIATVGGEALDQILKLVFRRPRPPTFFGYAEPLTYSFPSGHAITSVCFFGALAAILAVRTRSTALKTVLWSAAAALAGLIGLSRIYLGVHHPTDVLAGYAAAVVWLMALRGWWVRRSPPAPQR